MSVAAYYNAPVVSVVVSKAPLADQINASLGEVSSWGSLVDVGVVMHRSVVSDFDGWITRMADAGDWEDVFAVKRYAEQAGYSSSVIDAKVRLALSNIPMYSRYSLPETSKESKGSFWPAARYVLYGYRYSEELNWEKARWNKTSGFLALKTMRDRYGRAFYQINPDALAADSLFGTRWHESGSLMDSFLIFHKLGVKGAFDYSVQEWGWLNNRSWSRDHYSYSPAWSGWEYSAMDVFPNVAKLRLNGAGLVNWSRVTTDMQMRYVNSLWQSPQWDADYRVVDHHHSGNHERRLDGTLNAWILLDTFYGVFNHGNQTNMKRMLEGSGKAPRAWLGVNASDLKQPGTNRFRLKSTSNYSDYATAEGALTLFLLGISPQNGRGLAAPLISDRHIDRGSLNYRHFEFDYLNRRIKIPVWGDTTLKFMYGDKNVTHYFKTTGIYSITFSSDWNSISQVTFVSDLYPNEYYLWSQTADKSVSIDQVLYMPGQRFTVSGTVWPVTATAINVTIDIMKPDGSSFTVGQVAPSSTGMWSISRQGSVDTSNATGTYTVKAVYSGKTASAILQTVSRTALKEVSSKILGPYPANPKVGQAVNIESYVSSRTSSSSYRWDFGDGQTSVYANPVWYPKSSGTFAVKLDVTDATTGVKSSSALTVTVSP
ncbi:MAG: PKD domain-containing protein [Thaumarchaeota archaeon]|nr:PKD domain-containing protein [Nitrososphaerota archaeon]